jgi:RimJ/RimL family protein N-acetyltransferase
MPLDRQPVLTGPTLRLRPLREADRGAMWQAIRDPAIWAQHPDRSRATPEGFARWWADAMASGGALAVERLPDGRIVGSSRFALSRCGPGEVEIGWTFLETELWGGPANREMKRLMAGHALASGAAVILVIHRDNARSRRAADKIGARHVRDQGEDAVYLLDRPVA